MKIYQKNNRYKQPKKNKAKIRQAIIDAKNVPCLDCSIKYPWYVMDLDHVRGHKKFDLSKATSHIRSIGSIMEEIAKCDPVCANCHRQRTFVRLGKGQIMAGQLIMRSISVSD